LNPYDFQTPHDFHLNPHLSPGFQLLSPGHDFYAAPKLSPDGTQLAYLSWCHPSMPWDSTQLTLAQLGTDGMVNSQEGGRGFGN
jgi:hypothetical protein